MTGLTAETLFTEESLAPAFATVENLGALAIEPCFNEGVSDLHEGDLEPLSASELDAFSTTFIPAQGKATEAAFNSAVDLPPAAFQSSLTALA